MNKEKYIARKAAPTHKGIEKVISISRYQAPESPNNKGFPVFFETSPRQVEVSASCKGVFINRLIHY